MPHIELGFTISAFVVVLLLLAAVALSAFIYRHTVPPVSRAKRFTLIALRSAALFLLLLLLFEPLLRLVFVSRQRPSIAILIDNSKSMGISDRTGDRKMELHRLMSSPSLRALGTSADLRLYTFGARVRQATSLDDSLSLDEDATDISAPLRALAVDKEQTNIHAAVLLSDGSYNIGQNPLYQADQAGIPVYTIGIGDSTEQKDVLITRVVANDLVYSETQVPVDVTIKSSGYSGNRVEVTLGEGTKELDRKVISLESGTREYPVRLTYTAEGEGTKKYSVRVSSLPGELTTRNNTRSFYAKVLKNKLRVLMLAGGPSHDLAILKQTLSEEKNLNVQSVTQKYPAGFYEGTLSSQQLDSADCLILIGFPTQATTGATLNLVSEAVTRRKKPVLFLASKLLDYSKLAQLAGALPFSISGMSTTEEYVFMQSLDAQRSNPILAVPQSDGLDAWNRLPPIFRRQGSVRAKPEATVLGVSRIQGVITNDPLVLTRNVNRQRSIAVMGYGLWRWRLMTQGTPETEHLLSAFLANCVKWLTTEDEARPVKVVTTKESYTHGEPVEFVGQVYNATAQPVDNAQIRIAIRRGDEEVTTVLRPIGSGRYEGSVEGLGQGDYTFKATAQTEGTTLGGDNGRFSIGELDLEFQDTRMNAQLLRQLAHRTGGRFYTPQDISNLAQDITGQSSLVAREATHVRSFELWNWRYSLAILVAFFATEWFLRKRSGML